jgi:hypothetical protein
MTRSGTRFTFFPRVREFNDASAIEAALALPEVLPRIRYAPEDLTMIDFLSNALQTNPDQSVRVLAALSQYPQCASRFCSSDIEGFVRKYEQIA